MACSVTRLGDFLDFGQLFKAFGNNKQWDLNSDQWSTLTTEPPQLLLKFDVMQK